MTPLEIVEKYLLKKINSLTCADLRNAQIFAKESTFVLPLSRFEDAHDVNVHGRISFMVNRGLNPCNEIALYPRDTDIEHVRVNCFVRVDLDVETSQETIDDCVEFFKLPGHGIYFNDRGTAFNVTNYGCWSPTCIDRQFNYVYATTKRRLTFNIPFPNREDLLNATWVIDSLSAYGIVDQEDLLKTIVKPIEV